MSGVNEATIWAAGITVFLIAVFLVWIGLKAQKRPNQTGDEKMVGETGIVRRTSGFRNRLVAEVRGEFWWCKMNQPGDLSVGSEITVVGVDPDDLILIIKPIERS